MATYRGSQTRAIQAAHKNQDSDLAKKFSCSKCKIVYYAVKAHCPLCDALRQVTEMRNALGEVSKRLEIEQNKAHRLTLQVDTVTAIREAAQLLDDNDRLFLKTVLYQWKLDKSSVQLKLTHDGALDIGVSTRKKVKGLRVNGFLVTVSAGQPRDGKTRPDAVTEAHPCTSMGGLAIAEYYEEALNTAGATAAITLLVRGLAKHLPGATE